MSLIYSKVIAVLSNHDLDYKAIVYKLAAVNPEVFMDITSDDSIMHEVRMVYNSNGGGQKIQAIKFYRDKTGLGLKESKEYVERVCDCVWPNPWRG